MFNCSYPSVEMLWISHSLNLKKSFLILFESITMAVIIMPKRDFLSSFVERFVIFFYVTHRNADSAIAIFSHDHIANAFLLHAYNFEKS